MPNWIVAAHGWGVKAVDPIRKAFVPKTQKWEYGVTMVPPMIELVVFTAQNVTLGMNYGWDLWDALTKGLHGGEAGVYSRRHKSKTGGMLVPDYRTRGDDAFPTGVFEVCTDDKPRKVIPIDKNDVVPLSDILARAFVTPGVRRVYWGCCTELEHPTWNDSGWSGVDHGHRTAAEWTGAGPGKFSGMGWKKK